jgi:hypothetical protein
MFLHFQFRKRGLIHPVVLNRVLIEGLKDLLHTWISTFASCLWISLLMDFVIYLECFDHVFLQLDMVGYCSVLHSCLGNSTRRLIMFYCISSIYKLLIKASNVWWLKTRFGQPSHKNFCKNFCWCMVVWFRGGGKIGGLDVWTLGLKGQVFFF